MTWYFARMFGGEIPRVPSAAIKNTCLINSLPTIESSTLAFHGINVITMAGGYQFTCMYYHTYCA